MTTPTRKRAKKKQQTTRRELLRDGVITTGLVAATLAGGALMYGEQPVRRREKPILTLPNYRPEPSTHTRELAIIHGQDVEKMVRDALQAMGGLGRFVQKGERVLLKPNVGWDRFPEQAANTGPELVKAVAQLCREAGAAKVVVSDFSLNDPQRCFVRSGIEKAAQEAGAELHLPSKSDFVMTQMGGEVLGDWLAMRTLHEVDRVINLPIVKHHSLSGCTLSMKNHYGIIGGRRNRLHQNIHTSIVDLAAAVRPTLTIMDATRVLKRNGPTGGNVADVALEETIIAATDEVALDAYCTRFLDLTPEDVPFLAMAEARGLGTTNWKNLRWLERSIL
uniref:DUF362 domain-containing protein n=1 Tax=Magnetococcus massalia (strain MO-1) TaxID=451514 RepID=A0A1S7LGI4_MAGMO|nr:Conserved exported protein of unknown function [Candidatus Magnetococcus massalia]